MTTELIKRRSPSLLAVLPALFTSNDKAAKRFIEYFAGQYPKPHTRRAYFRCGSGLLELV